MSLTPNIYKIVTLNANAKEIITLKILLMQNTYKIVTVRANTQKIFT